MNEGTYIIFLRYWKKADGTVKRYNDSRFQASGYKTVAEWISNKLSPAIEQFAGNFNAASSSSASTAGESSSSNVTVVKPNDNILNTNCFGLGHDVKIFSNDGKSVNFEAGATTGGMSFPQVVQVDNMTTNDFRYG